MTRLTHDEMHRLNVAWFAQSEAIFLNFQRAYDEFQVQLDKLEEKDPKHAGMSKLIEKTNTTIRALLDGGAGDFLSQSNGLIKNFNDELTTLKAHPNQARTNVGLAFLHFFTAGITLLLSIFIKKLRFKTGEAEEGKLAQALQTSMVALQNSKEIIGAHSFGMGVKEGTTKGHAARETEIAELKKQHEAALAAARTELQTERQKTAEFQPKFDAEIKQRAELERTHQAALTEKQKQHEFALAAQRLELQAQQTVAAAKIEDEPQLGNQPPSTGADDDELVSFLAENMRLNEEVTHLQEVVARLQAIIGQRPTLQDAAVQAAVSQATVATESDVVQAHEVSTQTQAVTPQQFAEMGTQSDDVVQPITKRAAAPAEQPHAPTPEVGAAPPVTPTPRAPTKLATPEDFQAAVLAAQKTHEDSMKDAASFGQQENIPMGQFSELTALQNNAATTKRLLDAYFKQINDIPKLQDEISRGEKGEGYYKDQLTNNRAKLDDLRKGIFGPGFGTDKYNIGEQVEKYQKLVADHQAYLTSLKEFQAHLKRQPDTTQIAAAMLSLHPLVEKIKEVLNAVSKLSTPLSPRITAELTLLQDYLTTVDQERWFNAKRITFTLKHLQENVKYSSTREPFSNIQKLYSQHPQEARQLLQEVEACYAEYCKSCELAANTLQSILPKLSSLLQGENVSIAQEIDHAQLKAEGAKEGAKFFAADVRQQAAPAQFAVATPFSAIRPKYVALQKLSERLKNESAKVEAFLKQRGLEENDFPAFFTKTFKGKSVLIVDRCIENLEQQIGSIPQLQLAQLEQQDQVIKDQRPSSYASHDSIQRNKQTLAKTQAALAALQKGDVSFNGIKLSGITDVAEAGSAQLDGQFKRYADLCQKYDGMETTFNQIKTVSSELLPQIKILKEKLAEAEKFLEEDKANYDPQITERGLYWTEFKEHCDNLKKWMKAIELHQNLEFQELPLKQAKRSLKSDFNYQEDFEKAFGRANKQLQETESKVQEFKDVSEKLKTKLPETIGELMEKLEEFKAAAQVHKDRGTSTAPSV